MRCYGSCLFDERSFFEGSNMHDRGKHVPCQQPSPAPRPSHPTREGVAGSKGQGGHQHAPRQRSSGGAANNCPTAPAVSCARHPFSVSFPAPPTRSSAEQENRATMPTHPGWVEGPLIPRDCDHCLTGRVATKLAYQHTGSSPLGFAFNFSLLSLFALAGSPDALPSGFVPGGVPPEVTLTEKGQQRSSLYVIWGTPDSLVGGTHGIPLEAARYEGHLVLKVGVGDPWQVPAGSPFTPGIHQRLLPFAKLFDVKGGAVVGDRAYGEVLADRLSWLAVPGRRLPWAPLPDINLTGENHVKGYVFAAEQVLHGLLNQPAMVDVNLRVHLPVGGHTEYYVVPREWKAGDGVVYDVPQLVVDAAFELRSHLEARSPRDLLEVAWAFGAPATDRVVAMIFGSAHVSKEQQRQKRVAIAEEFLKRDGLYKIRLVCEMTGFAPGVEPEFPPETLHLGCKICGRLLLKSQRPWTVDNNKKLVCLEHVDARVRALHATLNKRQRTNAGYDFWPGERVSMQPGGLTLSPNEVLALLLEAAGEDVAKRGGCGREVTLGDMLDTQLGASILFNGDFGTTFDGVTAQRYNTKFKEFQATLDTSGVRMGPMSTEEVKEVLQLTADALGVANEEAVYNSGDALRNDPSFWVDIKAKVDVHPGCQPRTAAQLAACVQIRANAHLRYHEETYGQLYTEAEEDAALELLMAFPLANVVPGDVLALLQDDGLFVGRGVFAVKRKLGSLKRELEREGRAIGWAARGSGGGRGQVVEGGAVGGGVGSVKRKRGSSKSKLESEDRASGRPAGGGGGQPAGPSAPACHSAPARPPAPTRHSAPAGPSAPARLFAPARPFAASRLAGLAMPAFDIFAPLPPGRLAGLTMPTFGLAAPTRARPPPPKTQGPAARPPWGGERQ